MNWNNNQFLHLYQYGITDYCFIQWVITCYSNYYFDAQLSPIWTVEAHSNWFLCLSDMSPLFLSTSLFTGTRFSSLILYFPGPALKLAIPLRRIILVCRNLTLSFLVVIEHWVNNLLSND